MDFIKKITGQKSYVDAKRFYEKGDLENAKKKLLSIGNYDLAQNADASFLLAKIYIQEKSNNHKKIVEYLSNAMSYNHKEAKEVYYQYYDGYGKLKRQEYNTSISQQDLDTEDFKTKYKHEYEVNTYSKEIRNREIAYFSKFINQHNSLQQGTEITEITLNRIHKMFPMIKKEDIIFFKDASNMVLDKWVVFTANHLYQANGVHTSIADIVDGKVYIHNIVDGSKLLLFHEDGTITITSFLAYNKEFMDLVKLTKDFIPYLNARAEEYYDGKDYQKAYLLYLENAVKYNNCDAQEMLSLFYTEGLFVKKDLERAKYWGTLAERQMNLIKQKEKHEREEKLRKEEIEREKRKKEEQERKLEIERRKKEEQERKLEIERRKKEEQERKLEIERRKKEEQERKLEIEKRKKEEQEQKLLKENIKDTEVLKELYKKGEYKVVYKNAVELVKENNNDAQLLLGKLYHYGQGIQPNYDEARKWYTMAHEAKNIEATLHLAHLSYEQANSPSELKEVYSLYVDAYSVADKQACKNAIEISDLISSDYNNTMFWKVKEYELGDKEAGKLAATYFYAGLCDQKIYRRYFEKLAKNSDPLGLCVLATAYHKGYGCAVNKNIAREYEVKLIETLTEKKPKIGNYPEMFTLAVNEGKEAADYVLDYLLTIGKASIEKETAKRHGDATFLQACFNVQKRTKSICFILIEGRYYYVRAILVAANRHTRLFNENEEVTMIAVGEDSDLFMEYVDLYLRESLSLAKMKKEQPTQENWNEKVDACWALYDQGKYDEAYKMVLPIAKKGINKAINMMGTMHEKGKGVPADLDKAIEWYNLGIKNNYWACFNNLGNLYYNYSVDENQGKIAAYQFYKQVIHKVNRVVAKRGLDILLSGLVPYDEDEKQQWIKRLMELGEEEYVNALNK